MNRRANNLRGEPAKRAESPARYDKVGDGAADRLIPDLSRFVVVLVLILCGAGLHASAESLTATNLPMSFPVGTNASTLPGAGASVVRVFGALILVIAIFLGGVWLFRNWQRFAVKKSGGARLNLIEVKSLGQRQALYVVGYQDQRMLLASSPAGITLLSHLPAVEEAVTAAAVPVSAPRMSFAEAFQHVLNRKA